MSNFNINYQFNTSLNQQPSQKVPIAITPNHHIETLSKQHLLLSHTEKQQSIVLAIYLTNVIEILKTFRTLSEHIKEIKNFMGLDESATSDVRNVINQLEQNGFIISADKALETIQSGENYQPLQSPPVVIVRTANRVTMLKRFLQSAAENEYRYNARYEYLIIDDSKPELAEANAINITNSELNAKHIDRAQQQTLLDQWISDYPDDMEALQFLFGEHALHELSPTYGRTWNWGILLSAGKPVVFLDDDCLLESYAPPINIQSNISLGKPKNETVFLSKEKPLQHQLQAMNVDPIARLAEVLGMTTKQLSCHVNSFDNADYEVTQQAATATIKMAYPAVAGDPGSASPMWLYYLRGESAQRFWGKDEKEFNQHKTERFNWVGDSQPRLSFGGAYSVVARSFDNRQLLPPTLPIFRDEDALFTDLMHYMYPESASFSVPWAIAHLPEIERNWAEQITPVADDFNLVRAFDNFTMEEKDRPNNASPQTRLLQLSQQINSLVDSDESDIIKWMYQIQQAARASKVRAMHHALEDAPQAPDYWKKDISEFINVNIAEDQTLSFVNDIKPSQVIETLALFSQAMPVWCRLWEQCQAKPILS